MKETEFKLSRVKGAPVSSEDLLTDLRKVAEQVGHSQVTRKIYRKFGKYADTTPSKRFGSWNKALKAAGLEISHVVGISDKELFENLLVLWQHFGRQPRKRELAFSPSVISEGPYKRRFSTWIKALEAFVSYANSSEKDSVGELETDSSVNTQKQGSRDPSLRLKFKVLRRDNFSCQHCGSSPAKTLGVELHIDHVLPWSKGGITSFENLQTLCSKCNLGKGNLNEGAG